jgi:hypothetical protein
VQENPPAGAVTFILAVGLRVMLPLLQSTVKVESPTPAFELTFKLSTELPEPPEMVTGLGEPLTPAGKPETESVTFLSNPFEGVTEIV